MKNFSHCFKVSVLTTLFLFTSFVQADERLNKQIQLMLEENEIKTVEKAFQFVQSKEAKSYLNSKERTQALLSLSRLMHTSLLTLPIEHEDYREAFIKALGLTPNQVAGYAPTSVSDRLWKAKRSEATNREIKNLIPSGQCFPVETLSSDLQPKAIAVLDKIFSGEGLYTVLGGLKPASWLNFIFDKTELSHSENLQIISVLHCGDLVAIPSPHNEGSYMDFFMVRLDRLEDVKNQYADWLHQANLSKDVNFGEMIRSTQLIKKIQVTPEYHIFVPEIHIEQTLWDILYNQNPQWGTNFLKQNATLLKRHLPNLGNQISIETILEMAYEIDPSNSRMETILLDLIRDEKVLLQKFTHAVNGLLQTRDLAVKDGTALDEILVKIEQYNHLAEQENQAIKKKNQELDELPLSVSLKRSPEYTQKLMQNIIPTLKADFPNLTLDSDLETFLAAVDTYNLQAEEKNKTIQLYSDKLIGAFLGFPRYAIDFFQSNPQERLGYDFPTLKGTGMFVYVVPKNHVQTEDDIKIAHGTYRIFSHFIKKKVEILPDGNLEPLSIQDRMSYFRSFYQVNSEQCSASALDDLR